MPPFRPARSLASSALAPAPLARGALAAPARALSARALSATALASALAAGACGDPGDKGGAPAPSASAAPPASSPLASAPPSAPAPAGSAQPLGRRLACARMLPEAARDRLLPGFVLRQGAACPECGPDCTFTHPSRPYEGVQASYVCNEAYDAKRAKALGEPLKASWRKAGAVKGFGRGGVHGEKEFGTFYSVVAFDDDSDCRVSVDWMRGNREKALALAKLALEGVKQADLR